MNHWYYLHTNGALIHKRTDPGEDNSDFVKRVWKLDPADRACAWTILLEACALGANVERIKELAVKWRCDGRDLVELIIRAKDTDELRRGLRLFLTNILNSEPDEWFDWPAATPKDDKPNFDTMPGVVLLTEERT